MSLHLLNPRVWTQLRRQRRGWVILPGRLAHPDQVGRQEALGPRAPRLPSLGWKQAIPPSPSWRESFRTRGHQTAPHMVAHAYASWLPGRAPTCGSGTSLPPCQLSLNPQLALFSRPSETKACPPLGKDAGTVWFDSLFWAMAAVLDMSKCAGTCTRGDRLLPLEDAPPRAAAQGGGTGRWAALEAGCWGLGGVVGHPAGPPDTGARFASQAGRSPGNARVPGPETTLSSAALPFFSLFTL